MVAPTAPRIFTVTRHEVTAADGGMISIEQLTENLDNFDRLPEVLYRVLAPVAMPQGTAIVPVPLPPEKATSLREAATMAVDRAVMQPLVQATMKAQALRHGLRG